MRIIISLESVEGVVHRLLAKHGPRPALQAVRRSGAQAHASITVLDVTKNKTVRKGNRKKGGGGGTRRGHGSVQEGGGGRGDGDNP